MSPRPVVLIHGYSDSGESFAAWKSELQQRGYTATDISICTYETLTNEVTIKDIAEGLDRALAQKAGLSQGEPFDAIVHSTGMLVVRSWLTAYSTADPRKSRLKHLIGIAPATWGSPLAHKGRSFIGSIFKGRKELGPDFMEAGDLVLDGLELGSRFTWQLAEKDLLCEKPFYGPDKATPYVFIFCGNHGYTGLKALINEPGTDGTVRWCGCSLDTRKLILDCTVPPGAPRPGPLLTSPPAGNTDIPVTFVADTDHGSIIRKPSRALVESVVAALQVESKAALDAWLLDARRSSADAQDKMEAWQQFVVRVSDERGDPVNDYNLQLLTMNDKKIRTFDTDVHTYRGDPSFRNFHVNLSKLKPATHQQMAVHLIASSGTDRINYSGFSAAGSGHYTADFTLPAAVDGVSFFYPFTTTMIDIRINRDPVEGKVFRLLDGDVP